MKITVKTKSMDVAKAVLNGAVQRKKKTIKTWAVVHPSKDFPYVYLEDGADSKREAIYRFLKGETRTWKQFYRLGFRIRRITITTED